MPRPTSTQRGGADDQRRRAHGRSRRVRGTTRGKGSAATTARTPEEDAKNSLTRSGAGRRCKNSAARARAVRMSSALPKRSSGRCASAMRATPSASASSGGSAASRAQGASLWRGHRRPAAFRRTAWRAGQSTFPRARGRHKTDPTGGRSSLPQRLLGRQVMEHAFQGDRFRAPERLLRGLCNTEVERACCDHRSRRECSGGVTFRCTRPSERPAFDRRQREHSRAPTARSPAIASETVWKRQRPATECLQQMREIDTADELHRDVQNSIDGDHVIHANDVRVSKGGGDARFTQALRVTFGNAFQCHIAGNAAERTLCRPK